MKTHGDIDMENCHPYPQWVDFMGGVIGSGNKFGLLRSDGVACIINRKSGVEFSDSWLSNTYAWTPSRFGYAGAKPAGWTGHYSPYADDDDEFSLWESGQADWGRQLAKPAAKEPTSAAAKGTAKAAPKAAPAGDALIREELLAGALDTAQVKKHVRAAHNQWTRQGAAGLRRWVCDAPEKATRVLAYWYEGLEPIALFGMVRDDPREAAEWIEDLFKSDSISPNWLG